MFTRIFFFLVGFALTVLGSTFMVLYLNLITIGYSFKEYVNFIIRRAEIYYLFVGLIIIFLTLTLGGNKNGLHLWYFG